MWRDEWSKSVKTSRILTVWTSKVSKTTRVGPLLEVEVLQKCQNALCFNDLQVKTVKTHIRETLGHKNYFRELDFREDSQHNTHSLRNCNPLQGPLDRSPCVTCKNRQVG